MAAVDDLDEVLERCQRALGEVLKANPEPNKMIFSHRDDLTILNPTGSLAHEWDEVAVTMKRGASQVSGGEITGFETLEKYVTPELAYVVWVERFNAKVGAKEDVAPFDLRIMMIFRPEQGAPGSVCLGTQTP